VASLPPSGSAFPVRKAVGIRFDHIGDLIDQNWALPKEETHTPDNVGLRWISRGKEDYITTLVNGTPTHLLTVETAIHLAQPGAIERRPSLAVSSKLSFL